jgi:predicted SAM-dependent methyltransferase
LPLINRSRLQAIVTRQLSLPLRVALREVAAEYRFQRLHRAGVRKARTMKWGSPPKLNLGCGENVKTGWVNIDLFRDDADLRLDLREPLPFSSDSVAFIYSEHVFEHLAYPCIHDSMGWTLESPGAPSEAVQLLREAHRVLIPGGVFSVGVPDAERTVVRYARGEFEGWGPPWVDTPMHFVNYIFRQGRQHKYAYDAETLGRLLMAAGFVDVRRRAFDPELDSQHRLKETLYMEGRKAQPPQVTD